MERLTSLMTGRHGAKLFVASLVVVLGSTTGVVVRAATGGNANNDQNVAVAVNTTDGSEKIKLSFKVTRSRGDTADPGNAAVAVSSCENCRTIAISIQAVVLLEDPDIVSPTNLAIAVNQNCTLCETYADARQHVIESDGPAKFSKEGRQRIQALRAELKQIKRDEKNGDIPFDELKARVDAISAELADILADEFRASSDAVTSPEPSPSADASADPTVSPDATSSPEATASSTPEAEASPTPEPSATASPGLSG